MSKTSFYRFFKILTLQNSHLGFSDFRVTFLLQYFVIHARTNILYINVRYDEGYEIFIMSLGGVEDLLRFCAL